ncbi:hypothetical protein Hypma_013529 [Hypsizygus marmoreus]|uniref:Uncharacterized protein n=1 Tax=Hypsizygus marmoreus TaxID=39966 RepID=A0A369JAQ8_HYPMA|nr:hypothetical protein Hypma_013529 [Hypsizygus marmoreus]
MTTPSEYSLQLQHGITGGFAPPTPNAVHSFTKPANTSSVNVSSAIRADGTPNLAGLAPKTVSEEHAAPLVEELHGILRTIPTEQPPGSEDIYGLDTSIAWGSNDLVWANGGPQGCGGGESTVKPTDEEKAKFRRAVEIVNKLLEKAD